MIEMNALEMIFRTPLVDDEQGFDIHADGRRAAFAWNKGGVWEIFEVDIDSGGDPVQITSGGGGKFNPRYAPDGKSLAFVEDFNGSESYQIGLISLETGKFKALTNWNEHILQPKFDWFPDGKALAGMEIRAEDFALVRIDADTGLCEVLLELERPIHEVKVHPDGRQFAFTTEGEGSRFNIGFYNLTSNENIWMEGNGEVINARHPSWSPDGSALAFSGEKGGWYHIGIYDLRTRKILWVTKGEAEDSQPEWRADGKEIIFVRGTGAVSRVGRYNFENRKLIIQENENGFNSHPIFHPMGKEAIFVREDAKHPPDLWMRNLETGEEKQLTQSLPKEMEGFQWVEPEEIRYPGEGGVQVPALLFKPGDSGKDAAAAVVVIHGGPDWLFSKGWNPLLSILASQGWVVLAPNYRGSSGYGRQWQEASRYEMGRLDSEDANWGADYLLREGLAMPGKVAVTGRSHGGYLTMCCLTMRPELWCGGSAVVPFVNLLSALENSREDLRHWTIENYGDPVERKDLWEERSPALHLEKVQAKVQLICGGNDVRCPPSEAKSAHEQLLDLGKQSELHVFEDEGHVFLKIENQIDAITRQVLFLKSVLEPESNRLG